MKKKKSEAAHDPKGLKPKTSFPTPVLGVEVLLVSKDHWLLRRLTIFLFPFWNSYSVRVKINDGLTMEKIKIKIRIPYLTCQQVNSSKIGLQKLVKIMLDDNKTHLHKWTITTREWIDETLLQKQWHLWSIRNLCQISGNMFYSQLD